MTVYKGYGGLTGVEQEILYCVVTRLEIGKVKTIVRAVDPHAFVVSHPAGGRGRRRRQARGGALTPGSRGGLLFAGSRANGFRR